MIKKISYIFCSFFVIALIWASASIVLASGFQNSTPASTGGFSGPGPSVVTVQEAFDMRDDMHVRLRGNITKHLGKDKYLFTDNTGSIRVEIDHHQWGGQTITPTDLVEIDGEIDKDWNSVEIEVDRITKVQ